MANARGLAAPLGIEFAPPHRAERIRQLLDEAPSWSAGDMSRIHMDTYLASAAPLLDLLAGLEGLGPEAVALRDRLARWDRRMDAGSTDAAVYAALRSAVVLNLSASPALAGLAELPRLPEVFLPWLALVPRVAFALERLLSPGALPGLDAEAAVREAVEEVALSAPSGAWGDTHRLVPWQALPASPPEEWPSVSGDHDCVLSTASVPGITDRSARGPAARYVWDLARRENSLWVVPFGASGVPGHAHLRDQLPLWLAGELVPVITDWDSLTEERDEH